MLDTADLRRLPGKHVVGPGGERIGTVVDVYEPADEGGGTFATVTTGLLGSGTSFVPLDAAELVDGEVRVPYGKDVVRQAPRAADDGELSSEEEDRLFAHYGLGAAAAATATGPAEMTLSEERLRVGTERVVTGRARLRKYVTSETVSQTVSVRHEELRVVREPIAPGEQLPAVTALSEEQHEVLLHADRPVVQKDVVAVERVRLDTVTVAGEQTVTGEVRKEHVELDESPSGG